ncbi:TPA: hypothetical protein VB440_001552 [Streptococcus pyogenes]|uniref:hypothetical protein n=1 Tax=Streptococcus pyogenes TaxID=1314 RepID=UPI002B0AD343|nr:hypothetical protein [Streptococcus pyogenes]WSE65850.1 hypothetical protein VKP39_04935 [Streptococcus pyogenes]HEP1411054.1 hypothetical protein [Streptococcus pyogenes]HER7558942.1 hypothetical protein [Streptococcus pyogenes]
MENKPATAKFFKLNSSKESNLALFNTKIKELYANFQERNYAAIPTLEIDGLQYYISAMEKVNSEEIINSERLYHLLLTISRVDTQSPIVLADTEQNIDIRKREVEHGENEGLVVETRLIFDPFRQVIVVYNQRGTINNHDLKRFFCKIINVRGLRFEIILNAEAFNRLDNLDVAQSITYTIASPDNFRSFRNDSRSENGDLKFASALSGELMKITINSASLTKRKLKEKISGIFSNENLNVTTAKIEGLKDGIFEPIDLIKNKLLYSGNIQYESTLDDRAIYAFLNTAYYYHLKYLKRMYIPRF